MIHSKTSRGRNRGKINPRRRTLLLETLETRATPAVFAVTNVNDSGDGSLRAAITNANDTAGADTINFNIPGTGLHTIDLNSFLPLLTDSVAIDGWSQPGATNTSPVIRIAGHQTADWGLIITADHSQVRGLTISGFTQGAIDIRGASFNKVQGNFLGTDAKGSAANSYGTMVSIGNGSHNNIVGTDSDGQSDSLEGNVMASITYNSYLVSIDGTGGDTHHNIIAGNYFGANSKGPIANYAGAILIQSGAYDNRVGTNHDGIADRFEGNVIAEARSLAFSILGANTVRNSSLGNVIYRAVPSQFDPLVVRDGANESAKPPRLSQLSADGIQITVSGILDSKPNTVYTIEVVASPNPNLDYHHIGNYPQVKAIVGYITVATDARGHANFSKQFEYALPVGFAIAASATDAAGNTSPFSPVIFEGEYGGAVFNLHSNPTATKRIYLDFNGQTVTGTQWNTDFAMPTITAPPYITTAMLANPFVAQRYAYQFWASVAEDFRPFDIDVTTEEPPLADLINSGGGDTRWGIRVIVTPTNSQALLGVSNVPGAYLNSFDAASDTPAFAFVGTGYNQTGADLTSSVIGRSLGLHPDSVDGYSRGYNWQPIMVNYGSGDISQWSKGEYPNATNFEDDLVIITTGHGFGYRNDLVGDTLADAALLNVVNGTVRSDGIIERNTDRDVFAFDAPAGNLDLGIYPDWYAGNLNVLAELLDANGNVIASSNPPDGLDAHITATVPAGRYYLRIDGASEGDPLTAPYRGYTDYGSLGIYHIRGAVTPTGNVAPVLSGFGGVAKFVEDSPRVALSPAAIVNDANGGNFAGGYVVAKIIQNANYNDRLQIRSDGTGPGQIGLSGNKVLYSGVVIGSFSGGNADQALTVVLNSNATPSRVQALLRNIVFGNVGDTPVTTRRIVQFQVADGDGGVSNNVTSYVDVTPHNDSPSLMYFGDDISYKLASTPVAVAPNVFLSDPDSPNFGGGRLVMRITEAKDASNRFTIGGPFGISGQDVFLGGTKIGRLATADAGIGYSNLVIDLTANATPNNVQQLLRAISFSTTNASLVAARKVESFLLDGDGGLSATVSKFIFTET